MEIPTLQQALETQVPLQIAIPGLIEGHVIAEGFLTVDGLVFADLGWAGDTQSPPGKQMFHKAEGSLHGEAPRWKIGEAIISIIDHGDAAAQDWNAWSDLRDSMPERYTRARCRLALQDVGLLP